MATKMCVLAAVLGLAATNIVLISLVGVGQLQVVPASTSAPTPESTHSPTLESTLTPTQTPTAAPTSSGLSFAQTADLFASDGDDYGEQGTSVALSGNGTLLVVGGRYDGGSGSIWTYVRQPNLSWVASGTKAKLNPATNGDLFGCSVSLSGTGSVLAVGASGLGDTGGGYVFIRSGSIWTQVAELIGTGGSGLPYQGTKLAISTDGTTVAMGGPGDTSSTGATWVFVQASNGTWVQQGPKLVGTGYVGTSNQGSDVSLSADGNTLVVGALEDASSVGAAWVFVRAPNGTWSQQGSKLVGAGYAGTPYQGEAVGVSADGQTIAVGGRFDNSSRGATWVFVRAPNGTWSQQGAKLLGTGSVGSAPQQGRAVALSADGNALVIGGNGDDADVGATWVFARTPNGTWAQQGSKLRGNTTQDGQQGTSVAIASDTADTIAVGAPQYPFYPVRGNVWVFGI
jgi:hypothetical protein